MIEPSDFRAREWNSPAAMEVKLFPEGGIA